MNFGSRGGGRRGEINLDLTPMVDVVFQLVLFLLLATTFKKPHPQQPMVPREDTPSIQVDLPRASADAVVRDAKEVRVWVDQAGDVYIGKDKVDTAALRERLAAAYRENPQTLVVVKADRGSSHGAVVTVMDVARDVGLDRLAIATAPQ